MASSGAALQFSGCSVRVCTVDPKRRPLPKTVAFAVRRSIATRLDGGLHPVLRFLAIARRANHAIRCLPPRSLRRSKIELRQTLDIKRSASSVWPGWRRTRVEKLRYGSDQLSGSNGFVSMRLFGTPFDAHSSAWLPLMYTTGRVASISRAA